MKKYIAKKAVTPRNDPTKQMVLPASPQLAQDAVRQIMAAVQNIMRNDLKKGNSSKILQAIDKRRPDYLNNNNKDVTQNIKQGKSTTKKYIDQKNKTRNKREANLDIVNFFDVNATVYAPKGLYILLNSNFTT